MTSENWMELNNADLTETRCQYFTTSLQMAKRQDSGVLVLHFNEKSSLLLANYTPKQTQPILGDY